MENKLCEYAEKQVKSCLLFYDEYYTCKCPDSRRNDFSDWLNRRNEFEIKCLYEANSDLCRWMQNGEVIKNGK